MKRYFNIICSILLLTSFSATLCAQDIVLFKDGTSEKAKIQEITNTEVKYKKFSNLEGPTYTVAKSSISSIQYQNGEQETFTTTTAETAPVTIENPDNTVSYFKQQEILRKIDRLETKGRRKRVWTHILIWGGLGSMAIGLTTDYDGAMLIGSSAALAGLFTGNWKKHYEEAEALRATLAYSWDFKAGDCEIAPSINLLSDHKHHERAIGVGLNIKF